MFFSGCWLRLGGGKQQLAVKTDVQHAVIPDLEAIESESVVSLSSSSSLGAQIKKKKKKKKKERQLWC